MNIENYELVDCILHLKKKLFLKNVKNIHYHFYEDNSHYIM